MESLGGVLAGSVCLGGAEHYNLSHASKVRKPRTLRANYRRLKVDLVLLGDRQGRSGHLLTPSLSVYEINIVETVPNYCRLW